MPRIRTIKPEFPQSESMGRISRDARLLFIQLWTICDDSGRTRASSRMLASLLFPYDDDAPSLIDGWLQELDSEGCIVRYEAHGNHYLEVCNWLNHQRIDRPTPSKLPPFDESSRIIASPREDSTLDLRTKDQGSKDQGSIPPLTPPSDKSKRSTRFKPPDISEVIDYCNERGNHVDPQLWYDHYAANGWKVGRNAMKDWKAAVRTWEKSNRGNGSDEKDQRGNQLPETRNERFWRELTELHAKRN